MLFNSSLYLGFLATVVGLYYLLSPRWRRYLILLASYTFYWVWSVPFSLLLVGSTVIDYGAARYIEKSSTKTARRIGLAASLLFNLGTLALFKYADFFSDSAFSIFGARPWPHLDLILPLGISFYTFQTMSYTIDVYRGVVPAKRSLLDVAIYVSFFPQLVAGPIVRADELLPQLVMEDRPIDWPSIRRGLALVLWGLGKKVYVADTMGRLANAAYGAPDVYGGVDLAMGTYAFAIQIYCDFSGYSDIAIGSALLLGIRLPENFDAPYLSYSIREFWRRWHISLSTWLRDYLYIPLGGSRHGAIRTYTNLMVTMLLGGLWHGAGWNWVVWGGIQGGVLSAERALGVPDKPKNRFRAIVRWALTLHIVCLSWVFFRADSIDQAWAILGRIFTAAEGTMRIGFAPLFVLGGLLLVERARLRGRWLKLFETHPRLARWVVYVAIVVLVITFAGTSSPEFIYFQF